MKKSTQEFSLEGTGDLEESEDKGSTTVPNTDEQSTKVKISNTDEGTTTEENQGESDEVENGLEIILPNSLLQYEYYTIESSAGKMVYHKVPGKEVGLALLKYDKALKADMQPVHIDLSSSGYGHFTMAKMPIIINGTYYGTATVAQNVTLAFETLNQLIRVMIAVTAISTLLSFLIGHFLSGKAIQPIKSAYRMKERFIGDASHELRTPISVILLSMDLLNTESDKLSDSAKETLQDVTDEAGKMRTLVDKLLFIARNDAHTLVLENDLIDMAGIVRQMCRKYERIAAEKNILIELTLEGSYQVVGDEKLLDSVISTVMDNAVKYNKSQGHIYVTCLQRKLKGKDYVEIAIQDTGIGIPKEDFDLVFERFHRQDAARSKTSEGYGLGLSIAKDIVTAHKGFISIESEVNQYTKIIIQLPLA